MADKTITLDVKTDRKKIDDLIKSLQNNQKIPIELTPNDKKLKTSIGDFRKQVEDISGKEIDITTNIPEVTDEVKGLQTELEKRIEIAIDTQKSATSIREFKKAQKELQGILLEIGDDGSKDFERVAVAIGTGNDKVDELNDKIKSLSKAPIENLSAGFKGVKDSLLDLNFEEFNDRVKNLGVVSKQVSFKDLNKSLAETGKSFLSLGKLIATNPFGLLITAVGLVVANFDKLKEVFGPILSQLQIIGDVIGFVTDGFFALTDAIGLTNKADQKAADSAIAASEKRKKAIQENLSAQEAYNSATKDLTDEEIKQIEERTGVIIDNERNIFDIRIENNKKIIAENESQLKSLEELERKKGKLTQEEIDKRKELVDEIQKSNQDIIAAESQRILQERRLLEDANRRRQDLEIQAISDKNQRAKAQATKEKEERDKAIDLPKLEKDLKDAQDLVLAREKDIQAFIAKGLFTGEFAKQKEDELAKLKQDVDNRKKILDDANASITASSTIFNNTISDIDNQAADDAKSAAERRAQDQLKNLQDSQQILINQTKEGTAERLAEEIKLSQKTEEFVKNKGKQLGLTENEITLKIQEEVKKRTELEERYNAGIIRLSNEKNLAQKNIAVLEAKTLEERIKANTDLIEEGARQEIEELRRTITDKELLAVKEREITLKKNEDIRQSNLQLRTEEETTIIETGLLRIQNDIKAAEGLRQSTNQRIEQANKLFDAEKNALDKKEKLEIEAANGNEKKIDGIREKYRGLRLDAEKKLESDINNIRADGVKQLEDAVGSLNNFIQTTNSLTTELGASINNLVGGIANSIPGLLDVINDETATQTDKTIAYLQAAGAAVQGIAQVLSALSNQRLQEIQTEEDAAILASENEYNAQAKFINENVSDEATRKKKLDELEEGRAKSGDDIRKKYAAIELAEKRKAFNQQKAISLVQTTIATAQAVMAASTAGPIAGPILAGVIGALGAVQLALISSQKFPEGGGAPPSAPSPNIPSGGGSGAPSPTPFQAPQFFGIGQQQQGQGQPPQPIIIENNIVETDITSTQRNINAIETRASIV